VKVALIADLHGYLPDIPKADVLIIAGDVCPDNKFTLIDRDACADVQVEWLEKQFTPWLAAQPVAQTVMIWGNHDFVGEAREWPDVGAKILHNEMTTLGGLKILGVPWTYVPPGTRWALQRKPEQLFDVWHNAEEIDVDILITHGPPLGVGDGVLYFNGVVHTGDPGLARYAARKKPLLHVFGHIHEGRGVYDEGERRKIRNVAFVDDRYAPYPFPIQVVDL